jgi:serine phosphatase RsbU (regulator of sigma subunit)
MEKNGNQSDHSFSVQLISFRSVFSYFNPSFLHFFFSVLFYFIFSYGAFSQNRAIDSLQTLVKANTTNDTLKANLFNHIAKYYLYDFNNLEQMKQYATQAIQLSLPKNHKRGLAYGYIYYGIYYYNQSNYEYALNYYTKSLKLLEELNDIKGMGSAYINIGSIYGSKGDFKKALGYMLKGAQLKEAAKDERGTSAAYNNIGNMYSDQGKYPEALSYHMKSLKIKEHMNDKVGISMAYNNIGTIFQIQGKTDIAIDYQFKSLKIKEELDDKLGVSVAYSNIASLYADKKKYEEGLTYNFKSLKLKQELGDKAGEALCYSTIGTIYTAQKKTKDALTVQLKALKIFEDIGDTKEIIATCILIGRTYDEAHNYEQALHYNERALQKAKSIDYKEGEANAYQNLAKAHAGLNNYKKAFEYNNLYYEAKDSLLSKDVLKQVAEINTKYQTEKKEQEIQLLTKDQQLKDKTLREQKVVRIGLFVGLGLLLILSFTLYNRYRFKQKANTLLEKQKKEIEEQNILITDSIDYAKTIQEAVFPSETKMKNYFPDSFVLYKPKAIVSGDFYLVEEKNEKIICTVADCTGHGIPGAFMSLLGFNMLENIIETKNYTSPSTILTELNHKMVATMSQDPSTDTTVKHGMDASVITIDKESMQLQFAGAHNPLYQIRDNTLIEVKADKMSVGSYKGGELIEFSNHTIPIQKGDVFYLFSDGFPDQIGGPKRKKFYYPPFKELLVSIHKMEMLDQKHFLDKTITSWQGERDQTDDILVVGIRI